MSLIMDSGNRRRSKEKIIVIMGATGTGKSRLSVDLALQFPSEIINADKMQVFSGLDITTNKLPFHERRNVTHHLLGEINPSRSDFSVNDFRQLAGILISDISSRRRLPIVVGGSNSFIQALVMESQDSAGDSVFRYECCFLWLDVSFPVLFGYLYRRVDEMLDAGMFEELKRFHDPNAAYGSGLRKAIGVPEFDKFFRRHPPDSYVGNGELDKGRRVMFEGAVKEVKENTCKLASRQGQKIQRLRSSGWNLNRIDVTDAFQAMTSDSGGFFQSWEKIAVEPSVKIVKRFLSSAEECC